MPNSETRITHWLHHSPTGVLDAYAMATAFTVYFCMYAFRKPFTAATYDGLYFGASGVELKTALVVSQIIGYAASKYVGIKVCSELSRARRAWSLVGLIAAAELALLVFAVVPLQWKAVAIFFNGLPLGMVWGLVVRYLEGRRTSDILLAALACSFIVSSGIVKDIGRALMAGAPFQLFGISLPNLLPAVSEVWMPAATGIVFAPAFGLAVWLLNQIPEPTAADVAERTRREPMHAARRRLFVAEYFFGIAALVVAYLFLTAFRDFRDNYMVDVLSQLGYEYEQNRDIMSRMELYVALCVMGVVGLMFLVKDNRRALATMFLVMIAGLLLCGTATLLLRAGTINGFWWMLLLGLGSYLAYVPYNTVLFDRLTASTQFVGTAVFAIYLADSVGYAGSVAVQLGRDLMIGETSRLDFLQSFSLWMAAAGTLSLVAAWYYFDHPVRTRARSAGDHCVVEPTAEAPAEFTP
jgi:hypothetical protein